MPTTENFSMRVPVEKMKLIREAAERDERTVTSLFMSGVMARVREILATDTGSQPEQVVETSKPEPKAPKAVKKVAEKLQPVRTPVAKVEPPEEEEFFDDGYEHHWEHEGVKWRGSEGIAQRFDGKRWITDNTDPTTTYEDYGNDWRVDRF